MSKSWMLLPRPVVTRPFGADSNCQGDSNGNIVTAELVARLGFQYRMDNDVVLEIDRVI